MIFLDLFTDDFYKKLVRTMGCVFSSHFKKESRKLFQVWNVDENGRPLKCGKIEVTDTELILYQKHKPSISWPLRCLRRYGFDAEVFSFESGRRCPTGEGIYAFRCQQSEALFNLLQESIQKNGPSLGEDPPGLALMNGSPRHSNPESEHTQGCCCNMLSCGRSSNPLYVNEPQYINSPFPTCCAVPNSSHPCVDLNTNYARLDDLIKHEQSQKKCFYMNLDGSSPPCHFYANIGGNSSSPTSKTPPAALTLPTSLAPLTYAQLDLDNSTEGPSSPPATSSSPVVPKDGYVTIDFDKTIALSQSVQPDLTQDDSIRKTRHSSSTIPLKPGLS